MTNFAYTFGRMLLAVGLMVSLGQAVAGDENKSTPQAAQQVATQACPQASQAASGKEQLAASDEAARSGPCAVCPHYFQCKCDHATGTCYCIRRQ